MIMEIIWRNFLPIFFGPIIYHFIFPNNNILYKVRLSHSLEFCINLYIAYQKFIKDGNEITYKPHRQYRNLTKNISLLMEFFLPVVSNN